MKEIFLCASLALMASPMWAQTPVEQPVEKIAPLSLATKMATKTVFASGFGEPQGVAFTGGGNDQKIVVTDYKTGEVVRLTRDGKRLDVLAKGLKGPSQIVTRQVGSSSRPKITVTTWIYVTERKANRVIQIGQNGAITQVGDDIIEPLGISMDGGLHAVAHTTSKIYRWAELPLDVMARNNARVPVSGLPGDIRDGSWKLVYSAPEDLGARYGFRCLINDAGTLFFTDETEGVVWMLSQSGKVAQFAQGLGDPSGLAIGGKDRALYVCDESNGGRLLKLDSEGKPIVVATELGRPRGILFLDEQTALIANRDGNVWKLGLP